MYIPKATLLGVCAILIWSTFTAFMRIVTEHCGVTQGIAIIYTLGAILLCLKEGFPKIHKFSKIYLLVGGALFVCYEIFLSQAIGLAKTREQTIEISLINYLWPCWVIIFALFGYNQQINLLIWPGIALSFLGIVWSLTGGFSINSLIEHVVADPIPYTIVFIAAILWGLYCNLSKKFSDGKNGIPVFFIMIAGIMWCKLLIGDETLKILTFKTTLEIVVIAALITISYVFWETGIQKGNILLLAILSYFTPIFSILFSGLWLNAMPSLSFWVGVIMVVSGSLLCWLATKHPKKKTQSLNRTRD